jgi:neutral ceramidase
MHAERNGQQHHQLAMDIRNGGNMDTLAPFLSSTLRYVAMDHQPVAPDLAGGRTDVRTAPACHGQAFTQGTPVDGKGAPRWLLDLAWTFSFKRERYQGQAGRDLCDAHAPKRIMINARAGTMLGRAPDRSLPIRLTFPDLKRQGPGLRDQQLVGTVVPVHLMRIGNLCLVGLPGEITTIAGLRLEQDVLKTLGPHGVQHVVIASYANAYIGYVTTPEEYTAQTYEGGHTLFGPWALPGFITAFRELAPHLSDPLREAPASFSDRWPRYDTTGLHHRSFPGACIALPDQ